MENRKPCTFCDDTGWVDEAHPENPWAGVSSRFDATEDGAGIPCSRCNASEPPNMPPGFTDIKNVQ